MIFGIRKTVEVKISFNSVRSKFNEQSWIETTVYYSSILLSKGYKLAIVILGT